MNFLCHLVRLSACYHENGYAPQVHLVDHSRPPGIGDWITSYGTPHKVTGITHWPTGVVSGYDYDKGGVCAGFAHKIIASTNAFLGLQPLPQEVIDAYESTPGVLGVSVDYNAQSFQLLVGTTIFPGFDPEKYEKPSGPHIIWNDGSTSMLTTLR